MQVIHASQVLTPDGWRSDLEVTIGENGRIHQVGPISRAATHRSALLLPAPLNLHSHAFQRAMAGLTEAKGPDPRDSFWSWRQLMYKFLDQLTPEDVEAIAGLVFMEMLEAGYGAVAEFHYLHHDVGGVPYGALAEMSERIVAASQQAGIGLTLLPVHYQYGGCDLWQWSLASVFTSMQLSIVLLTTCGSITHPPVVTRTLASYEYFKTPL